jgi:predicted chitinase
MAEILTENQLRIFLPNLKNVTMWTTALNAVMVRFEITARERAAAFLAQVTHESAEFSDNDDEDFVRISVLINGGRAGLPARRAYWARAKAALA